MRGGMTLAEVCDLLQATVLWGDDFSPEIDSVASADLMSDVLTLSRPGMLLLTGLATPQAIRTAAIADLRAVVFVRGKRPEPSVVSLAQRQRIPVMSTPFTLFEASGLLYEELANRECRREEASAQPSKEQAGGG
jgi:predicted transcriptional regulator